MPYKTQLELEEEPDCCCLIGIYLAKTGESLAGSPYPSCSYQKASRDANSNLISAEQAVESYLSTLK